MPDHFGRREADIPLPPERCFAALADVDGLPSWQGALRSARVVEHHGDGTYDVEFEVDAKIRAFRYRLRLREEPPRLLDGTYVSGPFRDLHARWTFEPADGGGTRAAVEAHVDPGRFVPRRVAKLVEDALLGRAIADLQAWAAAQAG